MAPTQASKKANEKEVYSNLRDRRVRHQPKFKFGDLDRTSNIRLVFSEGDATTWSFNLYTTIEVIDDSIPSYRIDYLPERNKEILLESTKLSLEENNQVMEELNLIQYYNK